MLQMDGWASEGAAVFIRAWPIRMFAPEKKLEVTSHLEAKSRFGRSRGLYSASQYLYYFLLLSFI